MRNTIDASRLDLTETIVNIRRVAKTVKGGRNMRFSVTVVVGDGEGHVGVGLGKAIEIPEAVRKATEDAKKNLISVPTVGTTIPHRQLGVFGAGRVLLMPAAQGTGVIAGSSVRTVLEAAGIKDVRAKSIGSNNTGNMAYATLEGLKSLVTAEDVARLRGKTPEEILGGRTMAKMIKVTLTKSTIGASPKQKKVVEALGLKKMHASVELIDSPVTRGAVNKVSHLVTVEEL